MFKLVLTGGPCSGKTTSLSRIQAELNARGYHVFIISEAASEIINSNIGPNNFCNLDDFQQYIFDLQLYKENMAEAAAKHYDYDKVVIVFDRGLLDGAAYVSEKVFNKLCSAHGLKRGDIFKRYDAVFHLVTAAKGTACYTKENNSARRETPEEAIVKDDMTLRSWVGHPHLKVFDNRVNFNQKVDNVIKELLSMLGNSEHKEIERKYLIRYPSIDAICGLNYSNKAKIVQMYLKSDSDAVEYRLRHVFSNGSHTYYQTTKRKSDNPIERFETEKRITDEEYAKLLIDADHNSYPVCKTRYTFLENDRCFELDVYDDEFKYAILEVELSDASESVVLPSGIELVHDVTDNDAFKNRSIAKCGTSLSEIAYICGIDAA